MFSSLMVNEAEAALHICTCTKGKHMASEIVRLWSWKSIHCSPSKMHATEEHVDCHVRVVHLTSQHDLDGTSFEETFVIEN